MEWNKLIEYFEPVITVIIAGIIAIYQMRQNIKLNAKLKWKQEFRDKLNGFLNCSKNLYHSSIVAKFDKDEISETKNLLNKIAEFDASFFSLDIMLYENDDRVKKLVDYRDKIRQKALLESKSDDDGKDYLRYFYYQAKDLYNDNVYVSKIIK